MLKSTRSDLVKNLDAPPPATPPYIARGTPGVLYGYRLVAKGAGGTAESPKKTATASAKCEVTLHARRSSAKPSDASDSAYGKSVEGVYNSPADLLWGTPNPPPRTECESSPLSGSFRGVLQPNGTAKTDALTKSTTFSINCKEVLPPDTPFFGTKWSSSAEVKIFLKKPDVALYISRPGEDCFALKQKNVQVLKGSTARLCWIVTTTPVKQ